MSGEGRTLGTVAEINAEIARLERERDEYQRTLADPKERRKRRRRRQQLLGRAAETWRLPEDLIKGAQAMAGDEGRLFAPDVMREDGWKCEEGHWTFGGESKSG